MGFFDKLGIVSAQVKHVNGVSQSIKIAMGKQLGKHFFHLLSLFTPYFCPHIMSPII